MLWRKRKELNRRDARERLACYKDPLNCVFRRSVSGWKVKENMAKAFKWDRASDRKIWGRRGLQKGFRGTGSTMWDSLKARPSTLFVLKRGRPCGCSITKRVESRQERKPREATSCGTVFHGKELRFYPKCNKKLLNSVATKTLSDFFSSIQYSILLSVHLTIL